jgi:MerR family Zn(II)-responsive transcriptional regulator of zntA
MLIGELAKMANVPKDTIRHYVEVGILSPSKRRAGTRTYNEFTDVDLNKLNLILQSKSLGFSLTEMKPYIDLYLNEALTDKIAIAAFEKKLIEVETKISQLKQMRLNLKKIIKKYSA